MKFFQFKLSGYTLIELMVSISILALLATATAPAIIHAKKGQELQQAALGLKSQILEAQSLALAPPTPQAGKSFQYYGVKICDGLGVQPGFSYQIMAKVDDTDIELVNNSVANSFDTVVSGISCGSSINNDTADYIWFKIGNTADISFSGNDQWKNSGTIVISNGSASDQKQIQINQVTGAINVSDI